MSEKTVAAVVLPYSFKKLLYHKILEPIRIKCKYRSGEYLKPFNKRVCQNDRLHL